MRLKLLAIIFLANIAYVKADSIYNDAILPMISQCPEFTNSDAQIKLDAMGFSIWEAGRHNYNIQCYDPTFKKAAKKNDNKAGVLKSSNIKIGMVTDSPSKQYDPACGCPLKVAGSIISPDTRSLGESIPVVGVPFNLLYFSNRSMGHKADASLQIPVSESSTAVTSLAVSGTYAGGRTFYMSYPNLPNQVHNFVWDNKDINGNWVYGSTVVNFSILYTVSGKTIPVNYSTEIGGWRALSLKMGGWQPDIYHYFDTQRQILTMGTSTNSKPNIRISGAEIIITPEGAEEVYVFTSAGKHLRTLHGLTGSVKYLFSHDTNGNLIQVTDKYGQSTMLNRDPVTKLVSTIVSPKGSVTTLTYDLNGYLTNVKNPKNESYIMTYKDATNGLLQTFKKPLGTVSTFTYDGLGFLIKDQHSGGYSQTLSSVYTSESHWSRLISVTSSEGRVIQSRMQNTLATSKESHYNTNFPNGEFKYTRNGPKTAAVINNTSTETTTFSSDPRHTQTTYATGHSVDIGGLTSITRFKRTVTLADPNDPFSIQSLVYNTTEGNNTTLSTYSPNEKSWTSVSPEGRVSVMGFNTQEDVVMKKTGSFAPVKYSYHTDGRLSKVIQGDRVTSLFYDNKGFHNKTLDALGRMTAKFTDPAGRIIMERDQESNPTFYRYNANGQLNRITTANGNVHNFIYNAQELLASYEPPLIGSRSKTEYEYNLDRELTKVILPDLREIHHNYDPQGRLLSTTSNDGNKIYDYYFQGQMKSAELVGNLNPTADNKLYFMYQGPYLSSETSSKISGQVYSRIDFDYNDQFKIRKIRFRDVTNVESDTVDYVYDRDGLLTRVSNLFIFRNDVGAVEKTKLNNTQIVYGLDATYGELKKIDAQVNNKSIYLREFKRDKLGRITEENRGNGVERITYDVAGRISGRSYKHSGDPISSFVYDKLGNKIKGRDGDKTFTATFDSQDRLLTFNQNTYFYNAGGSISGKQTPHSGNLSFFYDSFGNLRRVDFGYKMIDYDVDAKGRRIAKRRNGDVVNRYVWQDQLRIIAEADFNGNVQKRFFYGIGINIPDYMSYQGRKYLFIKDHRGSVNLVVDSMTGEIKQKMLYSEWGEVIEDTNPGFQPFGFAGGLYDGETKLYRFGARDYDPEIGRWLSKDPIGFDGGDTNLYGYVLQDPVNLIDPNGTFVLPILPIIIIGIGIIAPPVLPIPEAPPIFFPPREPSAPDYFNENPNKCTQPGQPKYKNPRPVRKA